MRQIVCMTWKKAILLKNKSKFVSLKKTLLIASIILFTAINSEGQTRVTPPDGTDRIMKFYPNPAVTTITFDFQKAYEKGFSIQIFNFLGKPVHDAKNLNQKTTVDLSNFNRGVYIYQLRDPSGKIVESGKFQVSK
jgi:hypothetical protein